MLYLHNINYNQFVIKPQSHLIYFNIFVNLTIHVRLCKTCKLCACNETGDDFRYLFKCTDDGHVTKFKGYASTEI